MIDRDISEFNNSTNSDICHVVEKLRNFPFFSVVLQL